MRIGLVAALVFGWPAAGLALDPVVVRGGPKPAARVVWTVPAPGLGVGTVVKLSRADASPVYGQVGSPALNGGAEGPQLTLVLPELATDETVTLTPQLLAADEIAKLTAFRFDEVPGTSTTTSYGGKPVARLESKRRDGTSAESHELTFKPFHHLFDPATGKSLITAGAYPTGDKSKLYPHHRGLFFGWMKAGYLGKVADTWHGKEGVYCEVERVTLKEAGPVYARHRVLINWIGPDGLQFAEEEREVTVYHAGNAETLLDWHALVTTKLPKVTLGGDPQHAGFQFRAAQDVVATKGQTVYTRPDGAGDPGKTRNAPADALHVNLPFDAMTFTSGGERQSVVYLDRPTNPKPARFSEREYGRFGSDFEAVVTPKTPVALRYRIYAKPGAVTVEECEKLSRGLLLAP